MQTLEDDIRALEAQAFQIRMERSPGWLPHAMNVYSELFRLKALRAAWQPGYDEIASRVVGAFARLRPADLAARNGDVWEDVSLEIADLLSHAPNPVVAVVEVLRAYDRHCVDSCKP